MSAIGFLHTSPVHIPVFDTLVAELAPGTTVVTAVDERLLEIARSSDLTDERVTAAVELCLDELFDRGAAFVVCTCSTVGGAAESIGRRRGLPVVRVDRPMAETAVDAGGRIVVIAALESTVGPTRELLESIASDRGVALDLDVRVVAEAWPLFEAGDLDGYHDSIARALVRLSSGCDVIVLAQASMAGAAELADVAVPVLSSPRSAIRALLG